ncbi:XdhC family protein [Mesorhizobium sp. NBSH29]|uniref:XdhC family protein n=1 Tax=Mesorhizobium sp. NBSH29 TaxID=2654249 RepID=UPI001896702B|nr:XdhC family protein [Mesorhizobium sp. NBSH29]QPC87888.1 XdhC family protein [Mesorhizobium sp. NBSH29]
MDPFNLKKLNEARRLRQASVLVTDLGDGRDRVVHEGDPVSGALGEAIGKVLRSGRSGTIEAAGRSFFLNVHVPRPRLVVIGAVHISQALAPMAQIAGYEIEIIDPRTAFATSERFPGIALHAEWPEEVLSRQPLDAYTAVAAVTHDPKIDDFALKAALDAGCFYVGALGSRKTHAKRVERLLALGAAAAMIEQIQAPIGLPIGAASPAEIAVAVLAQIIGALRSRGSSDRSGDVAA